MFKLVQTQSYFWPVTVNLPGDGGKFEKQTFDAEFKRVPQAKLDEMRVEAEANKINDADIVRAVMVGWKGITDSDADVPFSETALAQLLDIPTVSGAIVLAFMESIAGLKRKN